MPSAGCMNSSNGCWPGWVAIRVWVIGGTRAPPASASAAACGMPAWAGREAGTVTGVIASAASVTAAPSAPSATGGPTGRPGRPDTSRYRPAPAVIIQSNMAAISNGAPFVPTLQLGTGSVGDHAGGRGGHEDDGPGAAAGPGGFGPGRRPGRRGAGRERPGPGGRAQPAGAAGRRGGARRDLRAAGRGPAAGLR